MVNDNVHYTLVEKLDGSNDSITALKTSGSVIDLVDGQIAVVNEAGDCVAAITAGKNYKLARNIKGKLEYTPEFEKDNVLNFSKASYVADTNKIQSLDFYNVEDNTAYTLNILMRDTLTTFGNKEMYKFGVYKTGSSATGLQLAVGLVGNLLKNFSREPEQLIEFEVLSDDAGTSITTDITVVNGLNIVTTGSGQVALGDFVRLGETTADNVYKVVEIISATSAKLDRNVTEASGAITSEKVADNDSAHISFIGVDKSRFQPGLWKFEPSDFDVMLIEDTASVSESQKAFKGVGTWQTVAEEEWFAQGNRGYGNRVDPMLPYHGPNLGYEEGRSYDTFTIKFKDQRFINLVGQSPASLITASLYGSTETVAAIEAML